MITSRKTIVITAPELIWKENSHEIPVYGKTKNVF